MVTQLHGAGQGGNWSKNLKATSASLAAVQCCRAHQALLAQLKPLAMECGMHATFARVAVVALLLSLIDQHNSIFAFDERFYWMVGVAKQYLEQNRVLEYMQRVRNASIVARVHSNFRKASGSSYDIQELVERDQVVDDVLALLWAFELQPTPQQLLVVADRRSRPQTAKSAHDEDSTDGDDEEEKEESLTDDDVQLIFSVSKKPRSSAKMYSSMTMRVLQCTDLLLAVTNVTRSLCSHTRLRAAARGRHSTSTATRRSRRRRSRRGRCKNSPLWCRSCRNCCVASNERRSSRQWATRLTDLAMMTQSSNA